MGAGGGQQRRRKGPEGKEKRWHSGQRALFCVANRTRKAEQATRARMHVRRRWMGRAVCIEQVPDFRGQLLSTWLGLIVAAAPLIRCAVRWV